jgi:hypothetical protein
MYVLGRLRDRERLAEAEHIRLVKIAKGEQPSYLSLFINRLGQHMVGWGERLQRYGRVSLPTVSR